MVVAVSPITRCLTHIILYRRIRTSLQKHKRDRSAIVVSSYMQCRPAFIILYICNGPKVQQPLHNCTVALTRCNHESSGALGIGLGVSLKLQV